MTKNKNWDDFKALMLERFRNKQTDYLKEAQLMSINFDKDKETPDQYLEKKLALGRELGKDESSLIPAYLSGLPLDIFRYVSPRSDNLQNLHSAVKLYIDKLQPAGVNMVSYQPISDTEYKNEKALPPRW